MFLRKLLGRSKNQSDKNKAMTGSSSGSDSGPFASIRTTPKTSPSASSKHSGNSIFNFPVEEKEEPQENTRSETPISDEGSYDSGCNTSFLKLVFQGNVNRHEPDEPYFDSLTYDRERVITSISALLSRICMSNGGLEAPIPSPEKRRIHTLFYRLSEDTPIDRALFGLMKQIEYKQHKEIPVQCFIDMQIILRKYIQKNTRLLYVNVIRLMTASLSLACESHGFPAEVFSKLTGITIEKLNTMRDDILQRLNLKAGKIQFQPKDYESSLKLLDETNYDTRSFRVSL